ncbi:hypothetical protein PHLGIDRAFT_97630 [Phlebiopsis gigantea 11061_1 CR5-6]|uniref:Uncharacterized protein n=1 Tax=Phlebiopsis gigantea (strain 11061_1 CR5-6) TaxID=745531 RepID=A0A0C3SFY2_PHLG1|nr:hypothetical protein PHLGIDRAFT_97630 [Phlebiopsis gigantea 11061_1 CR5-6]
MPALPRAQKLLALVDLVNKTAQTILAEWETEDASSSSSQPEQDSPLPSWELYNARRTLAGACGAFDELVYDPQLRLLEMGVSFFHSRALYIATEHRIADILAHTDRVRGGMYVGDISAKVGIDARKLARIMRMLTSAHIFEEVREDHFCNNRITESLVGNEALRACLLTFGMETYDASVKLPDVIRNTLYPNIPLRLAFKEGLQTTQSYFEWLEEKVPQPDGSLGPRPSLEIFSLAMLGGGRVLTPPVNYDFPWKSLGNSTVVDVGGGIGSMSLELAKIYPDLKFVVQDTNIWEAEHMEYLQNRVTLMVHDFFEENPVKGADVYVLRCVLHDWDDARCIDILKALARSMGKNSRLLAVELVMNTTIGCPEVVSASPPLPANFGAATRLAHSIDWVAESLNHGMERTPRQYRELAYRAGLQLIKVWECRSALGVFEMCLPPEERSRL